MFINEYLIKALWRFLQIPNKHSSGLLDQLEIKLIEWTSKLNNQGVIVNPKWSHYLFESLATLLKVHWFANELQIDHQTLWIKFENNWSGFMIKILEDESEEYCPYVLQLFVLFTYYAVPNFSSSFQITPYMATYFNVLKLITKPSLWNAKSNYYYLFR